MILRCLLFCSDEGTAAPILQALTDLGVEGELCPEAIAAVEKVTQQSFQIVVIDWEKQPEAALLLSTARERKAATRPLTLAIISDDASIPQALQAGANSILRKPLLLNQITDTLNTACDLLRSKLESAAQAAAAGASAGSVSTIPASIERGQETNLRAGEFLQSAPSAPGGQFETESDVHESHEHSSVEPVDPLNNLEPMAASVAKEKPAPDRVADRPAPPSEPRGLEWYLKTRAASLPPVPVQSSAPAASAKPELLGFDQTSSYSPPPETRGEDVPPEATPKPRSIQLGIQKVESEPKAEARREQKRERKKDPELLGGASAESEDAPRPRSRFKGPIAGAVLLAGCAILAAPQAPWHPQVRVLWSHGQQALHGWLNPQPATPVQAPVAHEDFGRAGDEYKLPATENIPDATTDPSQIRVVPVIDPTAKKTTPDAANSDQPPTPGDPAATTPNDSAQPSGTQAPDTQVPQAVPAMATATPTAVPVGSSVAAAPATIVAVSAPPHSDPSPVISAPAASVPVRSTPIKTQEPHYATPPGNVPSSLKSQMASMTPDASGNKPAESAMQSIEPVAVPELTERALLTDQPALDYPAAARGQQGTVVLQVLIGRDGTVQDAKFLQGSLVFAKVAIDGVKLWRFKPYVMNGRPVSVQTSLTITFTPGPRN